MSDRSSETGFQGDGNDDKRLRSIVLRALRYCRHDPGDSLELEIEVTVWD